MSKQKEIVVEETGFDQDFDDSPSSLSSDDPFGLDNVLETQEEEAQKISLDVPNLVIHKKDAASFFKLAGLHWTTGNDLYTRSFYLERVQPDSITVVYFNGSIFCKKTLKTVVGDKQLQGEFVIDLMAFAKALCVASSQLAILQEIKEGTNEANLFAYLCGGKLFIQSFGVSTKFYKSKEDVLKQKPEKTVKLNGEDFLSLLKSLITLSSAGTRAEERAVYFDDTNAYVYSGAVMGKFPGEFCEMCLQNFDIKSILAFFEGLKDELLLKVYPNNVVFSHKDDVLILEKRTLQLSSQIKDLGFDISNGITADPQLITQVVSLLIASPTNSGIGNIEDTNFGFNIVSSTRSGESRSVFPIYGNKEGNGLTKNNVRISLKVLKSYLAAFKKSIMFDIRDDRLYIKGDIGKVVISGTNV